MRRFAPNTVFFMASCLISPPTLFSSWHHAAFRPHHCFLDDIMLHFAPKAVSLMTALTYQLLNMV
jgi:hypothetical protein